MSDRIDKDTANYRVPASDERKQCQKCDMFRAPASCTLVEGRIARNGTCRYWEAKS